MSIEELRRHIKEKLKVPRHWISGSRFEKLYDHLYRYWYDLAAQSSIDSEAKYFRYLESEAELDFQISEDDESELRPVALNLARWLNQATSAFVSTMGIFCIRVASRNDHSKHYCTPGLSREEIREKSSRSKASKLYSDTDLAVQEQITVQVFSNIFDNLVGLRTASVGVRANKEIGADSGVGTNTLNLKIDVSKNLLHYIPISNHELTKYTLRTSVSV